MPEKCKVESAGRSVIDHVLLTALQSGQQVAVLCEEKDLLLLINALRADGGKDCLEFAADLEQLRKEAFRVEIAKEIPSGK